MRRLYIDRFILLFCCIALLGIELSAQTVYRAHLSGRHEVLPVASKASGEIVATLTGSQLVITGTFSDLSGDFDASIAGGSHVHLGYAGANGPIELALVATPDTDLKGGTYAAATNTFTLSTNALTALTQRKMYVNIHTTAYPGGELRGQLVPDADDYYYTNLLGSNEVPAVITSASGALQMEVDGDQLVVTGSFQNLSDDLATSIGGGVHLHLGLPGNTGGVELALVATTDGDLTSGEFAATDNTFTLTSEQSALLSKRSLYANIHSLRVTSGELRGQVTGQAQTVFRAHLGGANSVPVVTSGATGEILAELHDTTLIVSGTFRGLESDLATDIAGGAHLHMGMAGATGGIMVQLVVSADTDNRGGVFDPDMNTFELTSDMVDNLYNRGVYINIHSKNNLSGEIRGQLLPESQSVFTGYLSSIFANPTAYSPGSGGVKAELNGNALTLSGSFDGLSSSVLTSLANGAHLHIAPVGSNGPVAIPLNLSLNTDSTAATLMAMENTFSIPDSLVDLLVKRQMYVNVHTTLINSGELRSPLLHEARAYFSAPLSGGSQSPAVATDATGNVVLEWAGDTDFVAVGSFNDLSSDFATNIAGGIHIHYDVPGRAGGIASILNADPAADLLSAELMADSNQISATQGWIDSLRMGMLYVNVHSADNPSGEIRGQLMPLANAYFTATLAGFNEVDPVMSAASGSVKMTLTGNTLRVSGGFSGLEGDFDASVAGGIHIHQAMTGANGGIVFPLIPSLDAGLKAGRILADSNTYVLTSEQLDLLTGGSLYVNIHTTTNPSGELRGQALHEINYAPSDEAEITAPAAGAQVTIEGDGGTAFTPTWSMASDANGDALSYVWQLGLDSAFNTMIFQTNVGQMTNLAADFATVDALLDGAGVMVGSTVVLWHRAVATDGSLHTPGASAKVEITRGVITGVHLIRGEQFEMNIFPTVTSSADVNVQILAENPQQGQLITTNLGGQRVGDQSVQLQRGENNFALPTESLRPGIYFINLVTPNGQTPAYKIIKQ